MQIDSAELRPLSTSLFGFVGHEVCPIGHITLSLSLGEEPFEELDLLSSQ